MPDTVVYARRFRRANYNVRPPLEEAVWVVFEASAPADGDGEAALEEKSWDALWATYPAWRCPYSQSNPPPTRLEAWRHGFSSVSAEGLLARLDDGGRFTQTHDGG